MTGRGDKGLLVTTGSFSAEAKREATRDGAPPIDLIDGDSLCELLKTYELGVRTTVRQIEAVTVHPEFSRSCEYYRVEKLAQYQEHGIPDGDQVGRHGTARASQPGGGTKDCLKASNSAQPDPQSRSRASMAMTTWCRAARMPSSRTCQVSSSSR
jgi:hypothetical protein